MIKRIILMLSLLKCQFIQWIIAQINHRDIIGKKRKYLLRFESFTYVRDENMLQHKDSENSPQEFEDESTSNSDDEEDEEGREGDEESKDSEESDLQSNDDHDDDDDDG